jgi:hypothetical protein
MEPIALCGAAIVAFGLWLELEILAKTVVKAARGNRVLKKVMPLFKERKPDFTNRYVDCTPREFRGQHS